MRPPSKSAYRVDRSQCGRPAGSRLTSLEKFTLRSRIVRKEAGTFWLPRIDGQNWLPADQPSGRGVIRAVSVSPGARFAVARIRTRGLSQLKCRLRRALAEGPNIQVERRRPFGLSPGSMGCNPFWDYMRCLVWWLVAGLHIAVPYEGRWPTGGDPSGFMSAKWVGVPPFKALIHGFLLGLPMVLRKVNREVSKRRRRS